MEVLLLLLLLVLLLLLRDLERLLGRVVGVGVGGAVGEHAALGGKDLHGVGLSRLSLRLRLRSSREVGAAGVAHAESRHTRHALHLQRRDGVAGLNLSVELLLLGDDLSEVEAGLPMAGEHGEAEVEVGLEEGARVAGHHGGLLLLLVVETVRRGAHRRNVDGDGLRVLVLGVMLLGVDLLVLLEILRALESLGADLWSARKKEGGQPRPSWRRRGRQLLGLTLQVWGLRLMCTRAWLVRWSRFDALEEHPAHLHSSERVPALLRPM